MRFGEVRLNCERSSEGLECRGQGALLEALQPQGVLCVGLGKVRIRAAQALEFGERSLSLTRLAYFPQRFAKHVIGLGVIRLQRDGAAELARRQGKLPLPPEREAELIMRFRVLGVELGGRAELMCRFFE